MKQSVAGRPPGNRCLFLAAAFVLLVAAGCGGSGTNPTGPTGAPKISAVLLLGGSSGPVPMAGDTLVATLQVTNTGDGPADSVTAVLPAIPDLEFAGWMGGMSGGVASRKPGGPTAGMSHAITGPDSGEQIVFSFASLEAGGTRKSTARFSVPAFYPSGWAVSAQATVTYRVDLDGDGAAETVTVLSDDPASSTPNDSTKVAVRNEGTDFRLCAPGVERVYLAGSFNGWRDSDPDYRMFAGPAGREFGLTVPLTGRQEYKFIVYGSGGGKEWIGDPRAVRVAGDGFSALNAVTGVPLPDPVAPLAGGIDPTRLVIYELFVSDFSGLGRFHDVTTGLDMVPQKLAELGINAIELMPVTAIPGDFNWGYNPWFYFAVDDTYGSPEDFAALVRKAHSLGIAVILDMVFNHVGSGSPLEKLDDLGTRGTWINHDQPDLFGMKQLNWFSEDMRRFFLDAALFWIEQYGIDGFRMDLVDQADLPGYRWWRDEIQSRHPGVLLIGEDFSYPPNNSVMAAGFDAQWGGQHTDSWGGAANNFQNLVMAILKEGPYDGRFWREVGSFATADNPMWGLANVLSPTPGYPSWTNAVKYIVSHDERVAAVGERVVQLVDGRIRR